MRKIRVISGMSVALCAGFLSGGLAWGQSPDFDAALRQSRYYQVLKDTDSILASDPKNGKAHFARAVALNCMFAFEEAQGHFRKAAQNGVTGGQSFAGNTFDQFNKANDASIKFLPLKASYPASKTGYQIGIRGVSDSRHVQIGRRMLPKLAKHAESFFGLKPDRLVIFILPDGDTADEFYDQTKVSITKPDQDRGASAVKITVYYFEKLNDGLSDQGVEETLSHEFGHVMHTMRNKEQSISDSKSPTWWSEGMAVQFAASFLGFDKAKETSLWATELKQVGSLPYNTFIGDFQANERARLNYRTASLMIRDVIETKGQKTILTIIDDVAREDEYMDVPTSLEKRIGMKDEQLFNKVVSAARGSAGTPDAGPQVKTESRDYIPGDAILARDNGGKAFEPAMMLNKQGDTANVRFFWGGQARVPYSTNVRKFDWMRGTRVRCKYAGDNKVEASVQSLRIDGLSVKFADGKILELKYEKCEDIR